MYSWVMKTEELDDLDQIVEDLYNQTPVNELRTNTVGVLYVYYDVEIAELSVKLKEKFPFPIMGVSTMALLDREGFCHYGIEMLVLSDDEIKFEIGLTDTLDKENAQTALKDKLSEVLDTHNEKPGLILAYISKVINDMGDDYIKYFDEITGGVPVYGGIASDMFGYKDFFVFAGDSVKKTAIAFIVMFGKVRKLTAVEFSISKIKNVGECVTRAEGNTIYNIDDKTLTSVFKEKGILTDEEDGNVSYDYMQTPFLVEVEMNNGEKVEMLRNIIYINRENESASFLGKIPEKSMLRVGTLRSEDIGQAVANAFETLFEKLNSVKDYKFNTLIISSCTGRYINLVGDKNIEGQAYSGLIPEGMSIIGMYSYGEFCPKKSNVEEKYYNLFHNETFTILAL